MSDDAREVLEEIRGGPLTFGAAVRSIREQSGVSQLALANRVGITYWYLCCVEEGKEVIDLEWVSAVAAILRYPVRPLVRLALQDHLKGQGLPYKVTLEDE